MLNLNVLFIGEKNNKIIYKYNQNILNCIKNLQKKFFIVEDYFVDMVDLTILPNVEWDFNDYNLVVCIATNDQFYIDKKLIDLLRLSNICYKILVTDDISLSKYHRSYWNYLDDIFNEIHMNNDFRWKIEDFLLRKEDSISLN